MTRKSIILCFLLLLSSLNIYADVFPFRWEIETVFSFKLYFISLFLTIIIELLIGIQYYQSWDVPNEKLKLIVYCNLITHPLFWIIGELINWNGMFVMWGEISIVFIEFIFLNRYLNKMVPGERIFILSVVMNLISALIGSFIYYQIRLKI